MIHLLELHRYPILEQLQLEEALLKADDRQWCIINHGSPQAIVMGISGKPEKFIDPIKYESLPVPLIRRFSGGGTVFVDHNTLFITFICRMDATGVKPQQTVILEWTKRFYEPVFGQDFKIHENDYAFHDRKFGGNAQYLRKERWLHHTSFLWDYNPENMGYLKMPESTPKYRAGRSHDEFLCKLSDRYERLSDVVYAFKKELFNRFSIKTSRLEDILEVCKSSHHKSTQLIK